MKERERGYQGYGCWIASLLLFLALGAAVYGYRCSRQEPYRIVCLGDSIIGNERGDTSITALMADALGEPVYNGAFGGTTMTCRFGENRAAVTADCLSLAQLSQAIALQDFSVQNASVTSCSPMEYFPESMYGFQRIDFDEVEILVIEHGVNDYLAGVPLDNKQDPYDVYSFGGALRYSLEQLMGSYPDMRILLVTPTFCWYKFTEQDCTQIDFGHGILEDYVELELYIAQEYGVEILDNYHNSAIQPGESYEEWQVYTVDGVHLNEVGRELIAGRIVDYIQNGTE